MDNQTVIDTIVKYSKECIVRRFIKEHLKKSWLLAKSLNLPSANTIKIVVEELDIRLDEKENDIGRLFEPLFEGKDFGHKDSKKHSLTVNEIKDGYVMLDGEKYVILLRPLLSLNSDITYSAGILYPLTGILEMDLVSMQTNKGEIITDDLLNLIIKKKTAYEYLE